MKYELSLLAKWLSNPTDIEQTAFSDEVSRIRHQWINAAMEGSDTAAFTRYIRMHQLELLHLMETCRPVAAHPCLNALEELYLFLIEHFPSDADCGKRVPADHLPAFSQDVTQQLSHLRKLFAKWKLDEKLSQALAEPLEKCIAPVPANTVRTGRIQFIREMLPAVTEIFARERDREAITKSLVDVLCYLNLNSFLFYKACCHLIAAELNREKDDRTRNARLQRLLDHFSHFPVKQHMAYRADARPMAAWIAGWIERRLSRTASPDNIPPAVKGKKPKIPEETKVKTSLAIPELSTFLRLFFMTGVFINDNKKKVASFMATYVTSLATGSKQVRSAKSIYNRMYDTDAKTLDSVERILCRMQEKLQELRRELDERQGNK